MRALCDLRKSEDGVYWLIGVPWMPWTIISSVRCIHISGYGDPVYRSEADDLRAVLPGGVHIVGVLLVSDKPDPAKAFYIVTNLLKVLGMACDQVVAAVSSKQSEEVTFYTQKLEVLELEQGCSSSLFWDSTRLLHSQMRFDLSIYTSSDSPSEYEKQFNAKIKEVIEGFTSSNVAFILEGSSKKIFIKSQTEELADVFSVSSFSESKIPHPLVIKVVRQTSNLEKVYAPFVRYSPCAEGTLLHTVEVSLDVLCLVSSKCTLQKAGSSIIRAFSVQLESITKTLSKRKAKLQPYHFMVPGLLHPITAIYDVNQSEDDSTSLEMRKILHSRLSLPLDRPLLRIANALTIRGPQIITNDLNGGKRLLNVHVGLPRCGISGAQVSLIDGSYEYYHYLQDRCDDKGWGCAYRSLQTIISWFRLQHYTSVPVPSHRDIQAALVEIGDKEPSFIGSEEWIGAIELSFVLDKLLGVTSKILSVRSGAELPERCRELAAHFDTQGTPVMIGGGVLAYTLLGVEYNEQTGESAFLILDPHYTGGEDLKPIRSGGWCGWKKAVSDSGQEFFLRNKFYNLLLPQRPHTI